MATYPIGVTKSLGTWNFQKHHVERMLDNATYDAVHPDDTLILAGPARRDVVSPTTPRTLMALGMFQSFGMQTQAPVAPVMAIGSGRSFFLRGKSQSSWNLMRVMINGRNLLRALYHNAVEVAGLNPNLFDDPASLTRNSQYFINLDSELYYIPFGLAIVMRTKSRTLVAGCYLELCMINSYGSQIQAGQSMVAENVSGMCDRILPFEASDSIGRIEGNGRAAMDAVLGLAGDTFPQPSVANIQSFGDDALGNGDVNAVSA